MDKIIDPILGALALGIVTVLVAVIKSVGNVAIEYIVKKKEVVEQKLKLDKHEDEIKTAKEVWNVIEEKYRITDNLTTLAKNKADEFDKLLLEKIPYLTKDEVNLLRQSIAGELNKGKKLLFEDNIKQQATELIKENTKLKDENFALNTKLNTIKSLNENL